MRRLFLNGRINLVFIALMLALVVVQNNKNIDSCTKIHSQNYCEIKINR